MTGRLSHRIARSRVFLAGNPNDVIPIRKIDGFDIATIDWQGKEREVFAGRWMVNLDGYAGRPIAQQTALAKQAVHNTDALFDVTQYIGPGIFLVSAPKQMQPTEVNARLAQVPGFQRIVPDFRYTTDLTPNDAFYGKMWGLNRAATSTLAPRGVEHVYGRNTVVVATRTPAWTEPPTWRLHLRQPRRDPGNSIRRRKRLRRRRARLQLNLQQRRRLRRRRPRTHTNGTMAAVGNNGQGVTGVGWNLRSLR